VKKVAVISALALLGASMAVNPPPAAATDISLESRTYVPARGTDGESTHVLLYEYLNFAAEDLVQPGIYLRAGGWGRTDLADETFGEKTNSELQYGFVGWRAPQLNAEARAGRVSLTAGVARNEVFDGMLLGSDLPAGFDATIFGGIPVEVDEDGRSSDLLYGGRVSQGRAGLYRLGASYLKEQNDGDDVREEAGADLFLAPLPLVEVTGTSLYNMTEKAWARHDYRLVLGPFAKRVRLTATWASTDYTAYFTEPMNHAMLPVEDTKQDRIGGELEFVLGLGFTVTGEYVSYSASDDAGDGSVYGARFSWAGSGATAGAGYRRVDGEAEEDQYQEITAQAATAFGPLHVSVDAQYLKYEAEINGETNSMNGKLGVSYAATRSLELAASVEYGKTPEYDREVKGFFAMTWRYDASMKKGGTK